MQHQMESNYNHNGFEKILKKIQKCNLSSIIKGQVAKLMKSPLSTKT